MKAYSKTFQGLLGYWSRGKFYPAIMGGSDAATSAAAMIGGGETGGTESGGGGSQGGSRSQGSNDNSFAREVLDNLDGVSDSERPVLEKYLSSIDSQVNSRFQSIHDQYSAFKGMDPEMVQTAMGVMQMVEQNPQQVIEIINSALGEEGEAGEEGEYYDDDDEGEYYDDDEDGEGEYADLDPEFMDRFDYMEELLNKVAEIVIENQQQNSQFQEDQELEDEIQELTEKYGEFDEKWVLSYAAGSEIDLEDAVKEYHDFVGRIGGQQGGNSKQPGPTMLSGNGATPPDVINPTELSSKDTKSLVAQILSASNMEE